MTTAVFPGSDAYQATARDMLAAGASVQEIIAATRLTPGEIGAVAETAGLTQVHADQAAQDVVGQGERLLALLTWGEQHDARSTQALAVRARTALAQLDTRRTREEQIQAASYDIERLQRALTAAQNKLRNVKIGVPTSGTISAVTKAPARTNEHRQARAWAKTQGLDCPAVGVVPTRILSGWRQAGAPDSASS